MGKPKSRLRTRSDQVRFGADPISYLTQYPVWRFRDFDWDGPWGYASCEARVGNLRKHIEQHLASFETMTWAEILRASGGRRNGNNNHEMATDKLKPSAVSRLRDKGINADTIFSLRLDQSTRVYGIREGNSLRIAFFDPHHTDRNLCAYNFQD